MFVKSSFRSCESLIESCKRLWYECSLTEKKITHGSLNTYCPFFLTVPTEPRICQASLVFICGNNIFAKRKGGRRKDSESLQKARGSFRTRWISGPGQKHREGVANLQKHMHLIPVKWMQILNFYRSSEGKEVYEELRSSKLAHRWSLKKVTCRSRGPAVSTRRPAC